MWIPTWKNFLNENKAYNLFCFMNRFSRNFSIFFSIMVSNWEATEYGLFAYKERIFLQIFMQLKNHKEMGHGLHGTERNKVNFCCLCHLNIFSYN